MTNEDKHQATGDEEYQYPNEEYVAETTPPEQHEKPQKRANFIIRAIQNNKRVTIVIVVAIVALIAFKFMSHQNKPKIITTRKKPLVQQPLRQTVTQTQPNPAVTNQLSAMQQHTQENQTEISQLQNQITDLRAQLAQTHVVQTQLNQSMVVLVEQLKQLTAQTHHKVSKKVKRTAPPPPPLVFHLKAVVPGRAWIVSNNGLSESVSAGDAIPQYGTVKVVDANRGMVLTSSGKVIGYGENDH